MERKKKIAQLIIARLDGEDIKKKFKCYKSLVKHGIGGFIIFGGRLKEVRDGIRQLQKSAEIPLFIASDLEQGLGQQIAGGTIFPPAMAIAKAVNRKNRDDVRLLRTSIDIIAEEAKVAGINIIFSPVLDVNTNPQNPIICTRAFSDDPLEAAWFGKEFIKGFQKHGIIACAKHFPGHGDTTKDSHREMPTVKADIERLWNIELYPFSQAIRAKVKMIMVGHLNVPAVDPESPSSLSRKTIQGLLRKKMGFQGLVVTDAMNMHAVSGKRGELEDKACLKALKTGADILLHPENPEKVIAYLFSQGDSIMPKVEGSLKRILKAKKELSRVPPSALSIWSIGSKTRWRTSAELTEKSLNIVIPDKSIKNRSGFFKGQLQTKISLKEKMVIVIIDDDNASSGKPFIKTVRSRCREAKSIYIDNSYQGDIKSLLNSLSGALLIAAVFSKVSAWKGRSGLSREMKTLLKKAVKASKYSVIVGFCSPYILRGIKADAFVEAYTNSQQAQEAAAGVLTPIFRE